MAQILVITGSPRLGSNSHQLAEAFIRGAVASGHRISRFDAGRSKVQGCRACDRCWQEDRACIFRDGFTTLEPLLEKADILVFATPLYWFGMSAQIKTVIDRFYAYLSPKRRHSLKVKGAVLLTCGAEHETSWFDGLVTSYRKLLSYMEWKDFGTLIVPDISARGAIMGHPSLDEAYRLGQQLPR